MIKTHHNVGGLPEELGFELIEPLRFLFKDEVRQLGRELGLPEELIGRHPFPGPGLAVRILGRGDAERVALLQEADAIFLHELRESGWYDKVSQAFAVLLPVKSVGVMGDYRTYENVIALRAVETQDFMTADWSPLPYELLGRVANRIVNEVQGRQPRGLRRHQQAPGDDRVGIERPPDRTIARAQAYPGGGILLANTLPAMRRRSLSPASRVAGRGYCASSRRDPS